MIFKEGWRISRLKSNLEAKKWGTSNIEVCRCEPQGVPKVPALGRQRQEEQEFDTLLGYIVIFYRKK